MRLQSKIALVTGATSGIGAAIAQAFAQAGAQVVVTGCDAQRRQAIVETIRAASGSALCIVADLASRTGVDRLVDETRTAVGPIDILVNNAGIFPMAETAQIDEATFDEVIATNVKAPFFLTAAFAPRMAERGSGKIINITTVLAHKGVAGGRCMAQRRQR
jgi:NAD(P)-dependent dehydrogenase (short-subunit alcohol dehydrogenase family)